ncbi:O-methyltransferase [Melia azedarach]|uniref:O-methyltransferase n=2 Tax=Melia azedarach TaxID=155640 RepID=A0ACC1YJN0_MELAZ|nr:O-methyltransferase [Melia azedarach]KAJ4723412.1 O-methyltransferase [Melia azedarach]
MNWAYGEHERELLQAHAHVWNHIFNFINSMSLKCAIQLGIPDIINKHGKPMTLDELITALPIHPTKTQCIYRLMRILLHSGFLSLKAIDGEEAYVLTKASQLLVEDNPLSVKPFLLAMLDPILTKPWHHLSTWFQNDYPTPFAIAHGMTCWDYAGREPKLNGFFNEAMASDSRLVASVVIHKCKDVFEGLNTLVDVGGGTGTMARTIAKEFPQIECTVFDLTQAVADLKGDGNLKYVGGDMFEAIPPADALLLKWILHDWNDEECVKILKKCKEAITSNGKVGKVIIIDMIRENKKGDDESSETQLFFDMLMMVFLNGKERDEKEWTELFQKAGFSDYKINPILGLRSLIEIYP